MVDPTPDDESTRSGDLSTSDGAPRRRMRILRSSWGKIALTALALTFLVGGIWVGNRLTQQQATISGLPDHALTSSALAEGAVEVRTDSPNGVTATVDGREVDVKVRDGAAVVHASDLPEGRHELKVKLPSAALPWMGELTRSFSVDNTPPKLSTSDEVRSKSFTAPVTINGSAPGAQRVKVAGKTVSTDEAGRFSVRVPDSPATLRVTAMDRAGNTSSAEVQVEVRHPGMRAVHMTGLAWASDQLREPVLRMARQGLIDTVELDIKDESGEVQYDSQVPMAERIGAAKGYYDARKAVDQLHKMGVRVVGRLVAFKDPVLAEASWKSGHRDRVVRTASGGPYNGGYGDYSFTNFANPKVRDYNIDIAVEAARLGFDDILYDYVRRPDGDIAGMRFAGLKGTPSESIAGFLKETRERVRGEGAFLGASVFGITVTRPESVGQNIPKMVEYVDYVSPMIYPSHWGPGEYNVADPNSEPYKIVNRTLKDWQRVVRGTGADVIPWLQDFSLGVHYGPAKVRAQIDATANNKINSFLLWSPSCRYTQGALTGVR